MLRENDSGKVTSVAGRGAQVFLVGVIAIAFVGFVVGLRQGATPYEPAPAEHTAFSSDPAAVPATAYAAFDRRRHGPNSGWQSALMDLEQPDADLFAPATPWDEEARAELRAARALRRAFEGAPPTVPHPIDQMTSTGCMACHGKGFVIAGVVAPQMSHEFMHNCTQCHVEQVAVELAPALAVRNVFEAAEAPLLGSRAWAGAPPTIPHPTFMRENCMSCHGPRGPSAIRTSHPWQTNCMQCHAPSALRDQAQFAQPDAFLTPPRIEGQ